MTTGRINQITIVPGRRGGRPDRPPRRWTRIGSLVRPPGVSPASRPPGVELGHECAEQCLRGDPLAPTEFSKQTFRRGAADVREDVVGKPRHGPLRGRVHAGTHARRRLASAGVPSIVFWISISHWPAVYRRLQCSRGNSDETSGARRQVTRAALPCTGAARAEQVGGQRRMCCRR